MATVRSWAQLKIWGPIGILSLLGVFVWQMFNHPEWFQVEQRQQNLTENALTNELSDEERAIAAEIDSSDFLLKELESNSPQLNPFNDSIVGGENLLEAARQAQTKSQSTAQNENILFSEFSNSEPSAAPKNQPQFRFFPDSSSSPASLSTTPGLGNLFNQGVTTSQPGFNPNPNTQASEENNGSQTPLQALMEQYNPDSSAVESTSANSAPSQIQNTATQETDRSNSQTNLGTSDPTSSFPLNLQTDSTQTLSPSSNSTISQPTWIVPRTPSQSSPSSPAVESAPLPNPYQTQLSIPRNLPYTPPTQSTTPSVNPNPYGQLPSTVNPNGAYGYNSPIPNGATVQPNSPNTLLNPNPLVPQPSTYNLTPSNQPFSVPRPIPGRSIGGGRINTFANP